VCKTAYGTLRDVLTHRGRARQVQHSIPMLLASNFWLSLSSPLCVALQCRPGHVYNKFSWGNALSLWEKPREAGLDVRQSIIDFYRCVGCGGLCECGQGWGGDSQILPGSYRTGYGCSCCCRAVTSKSEGSTPSLKVLTASLLSATLPPQHICLFPPLLIAPGATTVLSACPWWCWGVMTWTHCRPGCRPALVTSLQAQQGRQQALRHRGCLFR
jgi:hypothetical protein